MFKKRPMTNAERVNKHRAEKANKRQVNLTLRNKTIEKLDRQAKQSDQTRSEFIDTLIASGDAKKTKTPNTTSLAKELSTEHQRAVLHVLSHLEGTYLKQIADDVVDIRQMRSAITRMTKVLQEQHSTRLSVTSNTKKKSGEKKTGTRNGTTKQARVVAESLDAIGLIRGVTFNDFPGAVSVNSEIKDFLGVSGAGQQLVKWRSLPRKFMAVWEAQKIIDAFCKKHSDATIKQRYMVEDKSIREITATYKDDRPDHRMVFQARNQ